MSTGVKYPTTVALLKSYYPVVRTLRDHIVVILRPEHSNHAVLLHDDDPDYYKKFLMGVYVASSGRLEETRRFKVFPSMVNMREMIDRAHERLFSKSKGRPGNVITSGYRIASVGGTATGGKLGMTRLAINNYYVNTNITALQAPEWELLHRRIGDDAILHLLSEASIFVPLPNNCLCQIVGEPIIHMNPPPTLLRHHSSKDNWSMSEKHTVIRLKPNLKRKASAPHADERAAKMSKSSSLLSSAASSFRSQDSTARGSSKTCTPAEIVVSRSRMFYAWATYIPRTDKIAVGLPPKHILNKIIPSFYRKPQTGLHSWKDPDPHVVAGNARHIAKYVFPRQYGLSNPFERLLQPYASHVQPDYSDREEEVKARGPCKTPKRLRDVLPILDQMLWKHGKCRYKVLLELACRSKVKTGDKQVLDSSIIYEMMSETSIMLQTQPSFSRADISMNTTLQSSSTSQASRDAKHKPRFAEFTCSFSEVYRYVALVTNVVIPESLWGSRRNQKLILEHVKSFISSRRYESITLHNILQGFRVADCDWLNLSGNQAKISATDMMKRRELLEEFLFWYFDSFVLPLLKTTFYVTESSAMRKRVLYFRQDDWSILCAPLIEKLSADMFEKLDQCDAEEILRQRRLGYSFVRLLPKETGVRPIVNLRRRTGKKQGPFARPEQSINQILQAAFQILSFEKANQPSLLGSSVFGSNEIYRKLKAFKMRLLSDSPMGTLPKLYFVKVDVRACFDTIDQTKLLHILRDLLSQDDYMIQKYGQVGCVGSKIKRKYVKKAQTEEDHPHFLAQAAQIAAALRNTIFVDQVVYPFAKRQDVIELLEEHITENIVKIGHDYYRQVVGIPQGSVLSALLCSFFYGDLERTKLKFTQDPQSLLLRLIDDYLFITTSLTNAQRFLDVMREGHPDYGCFISEEKTCANFEHVSLVNMIEPHQRSFAWCGIMINMTDLSVSTDYSRFHETYLQDSLTVEKGRHPGLVFAHKMLQSIKAKSHILFCDADMNSEPIIHLNIYQNFLLSAMKMHHYLRHWDVEQRSLEFVRKTVRQTIRYAYVAMRNKACNKIAKENAVRFAVREGEVIWLGTHAFVTVLSRKPRVYATLIAKLRFELTLPRYCKLGRRFRGIVKEGLMSLDLLAF